MHKSIAVLARTRPGERDGRHSEAHDATRRRAEEETSGDGDCLIGKEKPKRMLLRAHNRRNQKPAPVSGVSSDGPPMWAPPSRSLIRRPRSARRSVTSTMDCNALRTPSRSRTEGRNLFCPVLGLFVIAGLVIVGDCDASIPLGLESSGFARPKSSTFTVPSGHSLMFAGFRSWWMTPCSCAASSASAICFAIGNASSSGIGPCAIRSASVGVATSSRTSARHQVLHRRCCRCCDGSARRAPALRAGIARAGRDRARTTQAGS